jgi:hypothetical protein
LLLGAAMTARAQTASEWVLTGRNYLTSRNIVSANAAFQQAVLADPSHQEANFFYAFSRLAVLPFTGGANSVGGLLDGFGVSSVGRVYGAWKADFPRNIYDEVALPSNSPTSSNVIDVAVATVLPQIEGALSNLNQITSGFLIYTTTEFGGTTVTEIDYGDVLLFKTALHAAKAAILMLASYDLNVDVDTLVGRIRDSLFNPNTDVLSTYPAFLSLLPAPRLSEAKSPLNEAIITYGLASSSIRSEVDDQSNDLFVIGTGSLANELKLRNRLTEIQASLSTASTINATPAFSLNLSQLFDTPKNLRSYLPAFRVSDLTGKFRVLANSFPDSTFGGILPGADQNWWTTRAGLRPGWEGSMLRVGPDGNLRLLWRCPDNLAVSLWTLGSNGGYLSGKTLGPISGWTTADLVVSGYDSTPHVVWTNAAGAVSIWNFNASGDFVSAQTFGPYTGWFYRQLVVSTYDNQQHLLWQRTDGAASLWRLTSSSIYQSSLSMGPYAGWVPGDLQVSSANGKLRMTWTYWDGTVSLWRLSNTGAFEAANSFGPFTGWILADLRIGSVDNKVRVLWQNTGGAVSVWRLNTADGYEAASTFGPCSGWSCGSLVMRPDGKMLLPWQGTGGAMSFWRLSSTESFEGANTYGPYSGWAIQSGDISTANALHLLWLNTSGVISLWRVGTTGAFETSASFGPY